MFKYAFKRIARSYHLFIALTIGVLLATSFFAATNVAADLLSRDALNATVDNILYDFSVASTNSNWTVSQLDALQNKLSGVDGIIGSTHSSKISFNFNNTGVNMTLVGIDMSSQYAQGIQVLQGNLSLGANETYVVRGSQNESLFSIGQTVDVGVSVARLLLPPITIHRNLTVAGYVDLPQRNRDALISNQFSFLLALLSSLGGGARGFTYQAPYNLLLTDWNLAMASIIQEASAVTGHVGMGITNTIGLKVDRAAYLNPYDISNSITRVQSLQDVISAQIVGYNAQVTSNLQLPLQLYSFTQIGMSAQFLGLSLPIFLLAYFTGTMVSDVGYNFRRREIGLLLTKGYQRVTIRRMFLVEGVLIGGIAGAVSIFIGTVSAYSVLGLSIENLLQAIVDNSISVILSIIVGMFLGLLCVWRPSSRASKLEIIDALKQYVFVEETSEYKKLLPTVSLILGTYKLLMWTLGINVSSLLGSITYGNFIVSIVIGIWVTIDGLLGIFGLAPLMFLYGATKVFIRGSQKFQEAVMTAGRRFFGAFGRLATRNVKRNPARIATLVFIVSLIVSYGVFATGSLYSQYDYTERSARFDVGADLRLELQAGANVTQLLSETASYSSVTALTTEYTLNLKAGTNTIAARGINASQWREVAYWEPDWFIGDANQMFNNLTNDSIILSLDVAKRLQLDVGDTLTVEGPFSTGTHALTIIGLVGYLSPLEQLAGVLPFAISGTYISFVSEDFLNSSMLIYTSTANILIDTVAGTNGTALQQQLATDLSGVHAAYSVTTELSDYQSSVTRSGATKIQWLAISFAVVMAMVGTALVVILTLQEKDPEIALLSVRGFSKWQLFKTLLAEVMVTLLFALLLGLIVGYIETLGQVASLNQGATGLIRYRIALGGAAMNTVVVLLSVVLLAAIIPVWLSSRRPESKIDILRV